MEAAAQANAAADARMRRVFTQGSRNRCAAFQHVAATAHRKNPPVNEAAQPVRDPGPARGLLRADDDEDRFHHARIAPSAAMQDVVQHYWSVAWDLEGGPPRVRHTLPHPHAHLVFDAQGAMVHGVHTRRFTKLLQGCGGAFGVKFRPGGLRCLCDAPLSRLRERTLPLAQLVGDAVADAFARDIARGLDDAARVASAERWLAKLAETMPGDDARLAATIVETMERDASIRRVEDAVARWPISERSLQRLFDAQVGVGPKWVIQRYRLHEAIERIAAAREEPDWAEFAQDLGYYDQSHFIRDFRRLVGETPSAYLRGCRRRRGAANLRRAKRTDRATPSCARDPGRC